jgi:hypothetical protein
MLTMLSIVTAFFLFGALQGVNVGLGNSIDAIKGTHLRVSNRSGPASALPASHIARVAQIPGVRDVTGTALLHDRRRRHPERDLSVAHRPGAHRRRRDVGALRRARGRIVSRD